MKIEVELPSFWTSFIDAVKSWFLRTHQKRVAFKKDEIHRLQTEVRALGFDKGQIQKEKEHLEFKVKQLEKKHLYLQGEVAKAESKLDRVEAETEYTRRGHF